MLLLFLLSIFSKTAVHYNTPAYLGALHNECCCNSSCHEDECSMFSFFSFACFLHVDSNLHGDINVTVMFSPRALKQNR